jgi:hydrogenase nickel incorporation protein HypB
VRLSIAQGILGDNDERAEASADYLRQRGVLCVGLLSGPGAGKTCLLEETIRRWGDPSRIRAITGDVTTDEDAKRLRALGVPAVQINTEYLATVGHLEAKAVSRAISELDLSDVEILFIENVGDLVYPFGFRLGEHVRVSLLSITDGIDQPLKYPKTVLETDLTLITKTDLAPYVDVAPERLVDAVRRVRPQARVLPISTHSGDGVDGWIVWLRGCLEALRSHEAAGAR